MRSKGTPLYFNGVQTGYQDTVFGTAPPSGAQRTPTPRAIGDIMDWCPRITGSLQGTFPFLRNSFSLERTQDEPEYVGGRGVSFPSMQLSGYNSWLSCAPPDGFIIHLKLARLLPLFFAAVCRKGNGIWKDSKVKWGFSFPLS